MPTSMAIVFGSTTGYTEDLAYKIREALGADLVTVREVQATSIDKMQDYDVLILGVPTWHHGKLQSDWADRVEDLTDQNFHGIKVALFGSGDSERYPDNFQDAMGLLWEKFDALGAELIGKWPVEGYDFKESRGLCDDDTKFVGLAFQKYDSEAVIDERIQAWAQQLRGELGL